MLLANFSHCVVATIRQQGRSALLLAGILVLSMSVAFSAQQDAAGESKNLTEAETASVRVTSTIYWQPEKLTADEKAAALQFTQDLVSFMLFDQVVVDRPLSMPLTWKLAWESPARNINVITTENAALSTDMLGRRHTLSSMLLFFDLHAADSKTIAGCETRKMTRKNNLVAFEDPKEPMPDEVLVAECGELLFFGTEADIAKQIENSRAATSKPDSLKIPDDPFAEELSESPFSFVFHDCSEWEQPILQFFQGSQRESQFAYLFPLLKNLRRAGVFISGEHGTTLRMRLGYDSPASAAARLETVHTVLNKAQSAISPFLDDDTLLLKTFLSAIEVKQVEDEIVLQLGDHRLAEIACSLAVPEFIPGWDAALADVTPTPAPGVVRITSLSKFFSPPGYLSQSLLAKNFRGKRVRVTAEFAGADEIQDHCGLIVWACDHQYRTVSQGASHDFTRFSFEHAGSAWLAASKPITHPIEWQKKSVDWVIPYSADILSFGVFLEVGEVFVRNIEWEVIEEQPSEPSDLDAVMLTGHFPRNILYRPGRTLRDTPKKLQFTAGNKSEKQP